MNKTDLIDVFEYYIKKCQAYPSDVIPTSILKGLAVAMMEIVDETDENNFNLFVADTEE